ncbi:CDP-archaeol synthase [Nanoarchaeota archaeon]
MVLEILFFIVQCIYLFLPAAFANMAPVLFKNWFKFLKKPIDMKKEYNNKRIFGANKTWRGLLMAVIFAIIIVAIQKQLFMDYPSWGNLSLINYEYINIWLVGLLFGLGAIVGDLIESFFKRQINIKEGKSWIPFDQMDWIVGALIFTIFLGFYTPAILLVILIAFPLLHVLFSYIGYKLKLKKDKF